MTHEVIVFSRVRHLRLDDGTMGVDPWDDSPATASHRLTSSQGRGFIKDANVQAAPGTQRGAAIPQVSTQVVVSRDINKSVRFEHQRIASGQCMSICLIAMFLETRSSSCRDDNLASDSLSAVPPPVTRQTQSTAANSQPVTKRETW